MADEYWKKPSPPTGFRMREAPRVGLWSRSFVLRAAVWVLAILVVIVLAIYASAYLSGFDSVFDMIDWYRASFNF